MNILITTAEWKSALTCMRSLGKRGHRISLIGSEPYTPALYSKFCKERIISPKEKDKNQYLQFINQLVKSKKYDLFVPISDLCVEYFSEAREELSKYTRIILPSKEAIEIGRNKDKTYGFALKNGIPIPETYFPNNLLQVEIISNCISFPCVVKKPKGSGGRGNYYINDKKSLICLFKNLDIDSSWPVIQEFIEGQCFGFVAVCDNGKIINFFMHEKLRQYPETGGVTLYGKSCYKQQIFDLANLLISKFSWNGPISFDFFITTNHKCVLLEINPRFSGVTEFANRCGIDLPSIFLDMAFGKTHIPDRKSYRNGLRYRSIFPEEINSCKENKKHIPEFFLKFIYPNTHYDFFLDDPRLLLWQLKAARWDMIK